MIQISLDTKVAVAPWAIAILNMRVEDLAKRLGLQIDAWEEDGLGDAKGFAVVIPSGLRITVIEYQVLVDEKGIGPTIEVLSEPMENVEPILADVLQAFGLIDTDVHSRSPEWTT